MDYQTVADMVQTELIEKKSRFLATVIPCESEEEALAFVAQKKKEHWDANHNVFCYIIRQEGQEDLKRCSDDGEPQGTAGRPMLTVLENSGLKNLCAVVTRYFGGTLLGTGGLVRAYSHATSSALEEATVVTVARCKELSLSMDYSWYGKVNTLVTESGGNVLVSDFAEKVNLLFLLQADRVAKFEKNLTELTNGQVIAVETAEKMQKI